MHEGNLVLVLGEHFLIKFHMLSLALPVWKTNNECEREEQPTINVGNFVATYIGGYAVLQKALLAHSHF